MQQLRRRCVVARHFQGDVQVFSHANATVVLIVEEHATCVSRTPQALFDQRSAPLCQELSVYSSCCFENTSTENVVAWAHILSGLRRQRLLGKSNLVIGAIVR